MQLHGSDRVNDRRYMGSAKAAAEEKKMEATSVDLVQRFLNVETRVS